MALSEIKKIAALVAITFLFGILGLYVTTLLPQLLEGNFNAQYYYAVSISSIVDILLLVSPFLLLLIWTIHGRENPYTIPAYLSTVPNSNRKPWLVNQVFKGDPTRMDENAFYSTVLDLKRKGKVDITIVDGKMSMRILSSSNLDDFEQRCIHFLEKITYSSGGSGDAIKEKVNGYKILPLVATITSLQSALKHFTQSYKTRTYTTFLTNGRYRIWPIAASGGILLFLSLISFASLPSYSTIFLSATIASTFILLQSLIAVIFPRDLFGKWKGDYYLEKLQWDSFKRFLSDIALIKKYASQDLSIWDDWLVYGTALGVGDAVAKAIEDLDIRILDVHITQFRL